jgi:hypothetical protein
MQGKEIFFVKKISEDEWKMNNDLMKTWSLLNGYS